MNKIYKRGELQNFLDDMEDIIRGGLRPNFFAERNGSVSLFTGEQDRFGDSPGRSFGLYQCVQALSD